MPPEDQKTQRPCPERGCYGIMTFYAQGKPAQLRGDSVVAYVPGSEPGWMCDTDFRHWLPERPPSRER